MLQLWLAPVVAAVLLFVAAPLIVGLTKERNDDHS